MTYRHSQRAWFWLAVFLFFVAVVGGTWATADSPLTARLILGIAGLIFASIILIFRRLTVEVRLRSGRAWRVGSDEPEELLAAIRLRIG